MGYKLYNVQEGVYNHRSIVGRLLAAGMAVMFAIALSISLSASANSVTPSTNDENRTKGWAHVNATPQASGVEIEFVNPRAFASCFEYRTDGDTTQASGTNYNSDVTDGLYPFFCLNDDSRTEFIAASSYVEIRMVFGAESDERFDWTRFDVLDTTAPVAEIVSPEEGAVVQGNVVVTGVVTDENPMNSYFRISGDNGVVKTSLYKDGRTEHTFNWNTTQVPDGEYVIFFATRDSAGNREDPGVSVTEITVTVNNVLENKEECKDGGWTLFDYKNQGQCVASVVSNENSAVRRR